LSACEFVTYRSHAHGTKHGLRRLIPEIAGENVFASGNIEEYFSG